MDIKSMVSRMTDSALDTQLHFFKAQQRTSSRWVMLIAREQKRRRKAKQNDID